MRPVEMVDLKSQYAKIKPEIDAKIEEVIHAAAFINGSAVPEFQHALETWLGVKHVIPCGNGTDALQLALMALGLQHGDEVITVPFTFVAAAEVIALLGLTPVFVDVERDTFNMDAALLEAAITPRTRAIIPVHLFGQCCDMETVLKIARRHNLYVIEDACQAIGATCTFSSGAVKHAGTIGDMGCTSFFPSKNLGCYGDGGALFTNNDTLAQQLRALASHGMLARYYHDMIGINSRLDTLQAAILSVKLKHLDEYIAARQKAAAYYNQTLGHYASIEIPAVKPFTTHAYHQYTIKLKNSNRQSVIDKMTAKGIPVMIYYPVPLHLQKAFAFLALQAGSYPVAEALSQCVISLPMHTELDEEQLEYVVKSLSEGLISH
ncbi:MAG: DegT/DnrJ/EryC1/StrS family aminotransferase [Bacteroidales bacterium]|jgi:dTDP-4-amino-4,6-dideoxygalactose transaminase|nr:DegT/DnrJ/EryC1/StrS family aminotransferase [Bacteroidales bacterium]